LSITLVSSPELSVARNSPPDLGRRRERSLCTLRDDACSTSGLHGSTYAPDSQRTARRASTSLAKPCRASNLAFPTSRFSLMSNMARSALAQALPARFAHLTVPVVHSTSLPDKIRALRRRMTNRPYQASPHCSFRDWKNSRQRRVVYRISSPRPSLYRDFTSSLLPMIHQPFASVPPTLVRMARQMTLTTGSLTTIQT